jgi:hypothetical protein
MKFPSQALPLKTGTMPNWSSHLCDFIRAGSLKPGVEMALLN